MTRDESAAKLKERGSSIGDYHQLSVIFRGTESSPPAVKPLATPAATASLHAMAEA